jgi:hypothetical protein
MKTSICLTIIVSAMICDTAALAQPPTPSRSAKGQTTKGSAKAVTAPVPIPAPGPPPEWTKEPDSFRGIKFLSSEAEARSQIKTEECKEVDGLKSCYFTFKLGSTFVQGFLSFEADSFVQARGLFSVENTSPVRSVFEEKYGAPSVKDGQVWRWIGKTVSIDLDGDLSGDRQRLVKEVADSAKAYELETAYQLMMIAYKYGAHIPEDEAKYGQRKADAERHRTEFLSGKYGAFSITTNTFSVELKDREKKKGAAIL